MIDKPRDAKPHDGRHNGERIHTAPLPRERNEWATFGNVHPVVNRIDFTPNQSPKHAIHQHAGNKPESGRLNEHYFRLDEIATRYASSPTIIRQTTRTFADQLPATHGLAPIGQHWPGFHENGTRSILHHAKNPIATVSPSLFNRQPPQRDRSIIEQPIATERFPWKTHESTGTGRSPTVGLALPITHDQIHHAVADRRFETNLLQHRTDFGAGLLVGARNPTNSTPRQLQSEEKIKASAEAGALFEAIKRSFTNQWWSGGLVESNYDIASDPRCPTVGFMSHPSDCTQFIQCLEAQNGSRVFIGQFQCPIGSIFNPFVPVCDHVSNLPLDFACRQV